MPAADISRSFSKELYSIEELHETVTTFAGIAAEKLRKQNSVACEVGVFAYTNRFKDNEPQVYGNQLIQFESGTNDHRTIITNAVAATRELFRRGVGYKKAGVAATKIIPVQNRMHSLFDDKASIEKEQRLTSVVDAVNRTFGKSTIKFAVQGSGRIKTSSENQSPHYTTLWSDIPEVSVK